MEEDKDDESSGTHEGSGEHIYLAMCSEVDDPERKPQAKFNLKIWSDILPTQQDVFYEDLGKEMGFMRGSVLSSGLAPFVRIFFYYVESYNFNFVTITEISVSTFSFFLRYSRQSHEK